LTIVRARFKLEGSKEQVEDVALVDTGASVTIVDKHIADEVDVTYIKRMLTVTTASGHKMEGELAVAEKLTVEKEELAYAHLLVLEIPREVKEMLKSRQLCDWGIIGLTTLELLNLMPDIMTGQLRKAESFMLV